MAPHPYCLDPPTTSIEISPIVSGSLSTYSYSWASPSGAVVSGQNTSTLTTNTIGIYTVLVTNTVNGCATEGQVLVTLCTNLKSNRISKEFKIYPNPSHGKFILDVMGNQDKLRMIVFSTDGSIIYEREIAEERYEMDLSFCAKGLYFLNIQSPSGATSYQKIIID